MQKFVCASLLCSDFSIFFEKFNFFGTPMAPKKSANLFSLKIKSLGKQKFVYKLFLSIESQKIRKIVIRKFAIFSPLLIFKEKLIFNGSSGFN